MEEKRIVGKEVKMNPVNGKEGQQKLSYESLNQTCAELSAQVQSQGKYIQGLHRQIQEMNFMLQTKRMDYLFKAVELSMSVPSKELFSNDFIQSCVSEIQEALTAPQDKAEEE